MSINSINYNPYLYTGTKSVINSSRTNNYHRESSLNFQNNDMFNYTVEKTKTNDYNEVSVDSLRDSINKTKSEQGFIGKLWDGFKNLTGIGAGSQKAEKAMDDYTNGKITKEEMEKAVNGYQEGQKQCVDMVADIASGIASFGAFSLATGLGIAAAPFTGGASLGLVAAGFGIAGAAGAAVKVGVKGIDSAVGGRKYDTLGYDLATGGINGIFAPITAGIGGAAGKAVAGKVGVTAIREGGEVVVKEALEGTVRGSLTKTLLTTNIKYIGGSIGTRALALGTDMAVNGAISGGVDSAVRYVAGDSENKSVEGFAKEVAQGTIGGLILSPIIGGGMRLAGNGFGKLTSKLSNKLDDIKIGKIVTGENGIIRGADELNVDDIVTLYANKLKTVTEADINSIITRYSSSDDQVLARKLLAQFGQYSNIDSLNNLQQYLVDNNIKLIAEENSSSLSDIFAYLSNKKAFTENVVTQADTLENGIKNIISNNGTAGFILDNSTLEIIKNNPNILKLIQENSNIKLIVPEGWDSGLNMFSFSSEKQMTDKLDDLVVRAKDLLHSGMSEDEVIEELLNGDIKRQLSSLNIEDNIKFVKNNSIKLDTQMNNNELARLYSSNKLTIDDLNEILSHYSEEDRQVVLEILAQTSKPSSMATLSAKTKKQFDDITALAKTKNINKEDIYYLVPTVEAGEGKKSYGMVSEIFKQTNSIPQEKFICDISELPADKKTMLVILDDFSGSGKSLIDDYRALTNPNEIISEKITKDANKAVEKGTYIEDINKYIDTKINEELSKDSSELIPFNSLLKKYEGEIVIAPLASTTGESSAIENFAKYTLADSKLTFMPAEEIPLFFDSEYFKSLTKDQQRLFKEIIKPLDTFERFDPIGDKAAKWKSPNDIEGYFGFRGNATSIVFPYMAPNNNNAFYSTFIAPLFTLNGAGVKNRWIKK